MEWSGIHHSEKKHFHQGDTAIFTVKYLLHIMEGPLEIHLGMITLQHALLSAFLRGFRAEPSGGFVPSIA